MRSIAATRKRGPNTREESDYKSRTKFFTHTSALATVAISKNGSVNVFRAPLEPLANALPRAQPSNL
jgi:hypothetical protein